MSSLNRREFLKNTLTNLVQVAGSVTLASVAVARTSSASAETQSRGGDPGGASHDLQQSADELAAAYYKPVPGLEGEPDEQGQIDFLQRGRGFRNGGWGNGRFGSPRSRRWGGPWRNGLWNNGGWRNFPFLNGGWPNGFWSNFPWRNGNWINAGFRF